MISRWFQGYEPMQRIRRRNKPMHLSLNLRELGKSAPPDKVKPTGI